MAQGRFRKHDCDNDGNPIGRENENPIFDSREYVVEFKDGMEAELSVNAIAQIMYAQCEPDGNTYVLFDYITNFRRSTTDLCYADQTVRKAYGRTLLGEPTAVWQLCVPWKDGYTSWEKISDLKDSHPLETTEYAVSQSLEHEAAFNWWITFVLKKCDRINSLVKQRSARYLKLNEKYGINFPKTVKEAQMLDKENGNTLWSDAIVKEITDFKVAFKIIDDDESIPRNHQFVKCHIFSILTQKII